ncbi:PREDICTED: uncharacterized protein LOC105136459 [Populus euphratica]|uniref:Uncharacterized protein LOC105136459 n=1 Tax=Populus euphratica TaxID=75702 RepID=A0AAJ6Y2H6_POPEU|nr:PREDICTED: uncharacterized protein LOC105136459 [Populus euphratica]
MGNYNSTTDSGPSAYSRLPSSHYSPDDDHPLSDPLLSNITQRMEEQHQQLLHHIYEATRVKETVKSVTTSSSSSNPNPPPSKPTEQKPNGHHALEKELHQELMIRHGDAKPKALASCPSCYKQGEAIQRLKEKNASLEKRVMELTATIEEMKSSNDSYINNKNIKIPAAGSGSGSTPHQIIISTPIISDDLINLQTSPAPDSTNEIDQMKDNSMMSEQSSTTQALQSEIIYGSLNDLTGCLVVLIFLVAVLVGVLL